MNDIKPRPRPRFEVNTAALDKGSRLGLDELEVILRVSRDRYEWGARMVALCKQVRQELAEEGRPCIVVQIDRELRVLTDEEAHDILPKKFRGVDRRRKRYAADFVGGIDVARLPEAKRTKHLHATNAVARRMELERQVAERVKRDQLMLAGKRKT